MNNLMTLWAEGFKKLYPNVTDRDRGQGLGDRRRRADRGHGQLRPDEPRDEGRRRSTSSRRSSATSRPTLRDEHRHARGLRPQGQPDQEPDAASRSTRSSRRRARAALAKDIRTWGDLGLDRRVGRQADQPLRPQLGLGHLRLLQGARALQGRLQGHRQGAAGQLGGRAGRRQRQVTRSATAASATRPPTCAPCRWPRSGRRRPIEADAENAYTGEYPLCALPLRLRQPQAGRRSSIRCAASSSATCFSKRGPGRTSG